jgi:hypothetical protein
MYYSSGAEIRLYPVTPPPEAIAELQAARMEYLPQLYPTGESLPNELDKWSQNSALANKEPN